jgi:hypothetical protein
MNMKMINEEEVQYCLKKVAWINSGIVSEINLNKIIDLLFFKQLGI